jgi:hypothetical protein
MNSDIVYNQYNRQDKKNNFFKKIYNKPIEIYLMWGIIIITILILFGMIFSDSLFCRYNMRDLEFVR